MMPPRQLRRGGWFDWASLEIETMGWFEVDREGLAAILERRGKAFAIAELVSNAWDSGSDRVKITMEPIANSPTVDIKVEDWGDGFADLDHAYTMFARSSRAGHADKRGRFCLGEKLVLACCVEAKIVTTSGTLVFKDGERKRHNTVTRDKGTLFSAIMRMTRAEYEDAVNFLMRSQPPVTTILNGEEIARPDSLRRFSARLPTEIADADGQLRRSVRACEVELFETQDAAGELLEMGIPVVEIDMPWRINVLQKVPLNMDRDNVTPAFIKALQAAVLNNAHDVLTPEMSTESWVADATGDARATTEAVSSVVRARFGDRAVIATPNDPIANAQAEANGYTVIPGGAMSSGAWANVRKGELLIPASKVFPSMTPEQRAAASQSAAGGCPLCGK